MAFSDNSPTDEWDDWGATENVTPQSDFGGQEESWDDWGDQSSQSSQTSNEEDDWSSQPSNRGSQPNQNINEGWDDWDSQQTQDDWDSQSSQSTNEGWDDWGSQPSNRASQQTQDNWSNQSPQEDWNSQPNQSGNFIDHSAPQEEWGNWNDANTSPVKEATPVKFNYSSKKIAFIIAGVFLGLAIIFMGIDKIHMGKKSNQPQQQVQQQVQQQQPQVQNQQPVQQQPQQPQAQTQPVANGVTLVEIPDSTVLNYSGDVFEANGVVSAKTKYVQGHQVLYCITISLTFGASSENINYYCNYASYNAVTVGDIVVVSYQQVEDNYISVSAISK